MAIPTPTGRRKRWKAANVGGLVQLAGFTLSVFNRHGLTSIRESLEGNQEESKYVASKVTEAFLRLYQLINYTEKVYQAMTNVAVNNSKLHLEHKKETIIAEVDRLSHIFVAETSMFQNLLDNQFSPLLVDPEQVQMCMMK